MCIVDRSKKRWIWSSLDIQLFVYFLRQNNLPFPNWRMGFSLLGCVYICVSFLFGIPHLSFMLLPCFRPYAWLTCPSSSDTLNTTPPWNHQLQSSDLLGPVCSSVRIPPGSLPLHFCLMHLQCRAVVPFTPCDVLCRYSWLKDHLISDSWGG